MIENELPGIEETFNFTHVVCPRQANSSYRDSCLTYTSYIPTTLAHKCSFHPLPSAVTSQAFTPMYPFRVFSSLPLLIYLLPLYCLYPGCLVLSADSYKLDKCCEGKKKSIIGRPNVIEDLRGSPGMFKSTFKRWVGVGQLKTGRENVPSSGRCVRPWSGKELGSFKELKDSHWDRVLRNHGPGGSKWGGIPTNVCLRSHVIGFWTLS